MRLLSLFFALLLLAACSSSAEKAVRFNDQLVDLANQCIEQKDALTDAVNGGDCGKADSALKALAAGAKHALDSVKLITPSDVPEDKNFYEAAKAYYQSVSSLAQNEYAEYCRLYCMPDSLFTENDEKRHEELAKIINERDSLADAAFEMAQKRFATRHQINIK